MNIGPGHTKILSLVVVVVVVVVILSMEKTKVGN